MADGTTNLPPPYGPDKDPDARALYGVELRYVLTDLIDGPEQRVWTVAELVDALEAGGFRLDGRSSKTISDSLRAEVNRGRVIRVRRGRYRSGFIPGATRRRIRKRARARWAALERTVLDELVGVVGR